MGHRVRIDGTLVQESLVPEGTVIVDGATLAYAGPSAELPPEFAALPTTRFATYVLPGLVDLHCHGGGGFDFGTSDEVGARAIAASHAQAGSTTLYATISAAPVPAMVDATQRAAQWASAGIVDGIHIEGPFLAPSRCGAQNAQAFLEPSVEVAKEFLAASNGHLVTLTLAPELPGAIDVAIELAGHGVALGIGHTDASAADVLAFLDAVRPALEGTDRLIRIVHLFNSMRPLHQRDPGPALAGMAAAARGEAVVELIADGTHLDPATTTGVFDLVGAEHIALITDAIAVAGQGDGNFGDIRVKGGTATLSDAHTIAGGTNRLIDVVRHTWRCGVPLVDAVRAGAATPARAIGRSDVGELAVGKRAHLILTDADLVVEAVMRSGQWL